MTLAGTPQPEALDGALLTRLSHVRAHHALCVAVHPAALAALRERPRVEAHAREELIDNGLLAESLDLVVCGTGALAARPRRAVRELARLLRSGGRAILTANGGGDELVALLVAAGFLVAREPAAGGTELLTAVRGLGRSRSLALIN